MKYILYNLKKFVCNDKFFFFLVILCVIASSFIINFAYGLFQNYNIIKEEKESDLQDLKIFFDNSGDNKAAKYRLKSTILSFSDDINSIVDMYLVKTPYQPGDNEHTIWIRFCIDDRQVVPCKVFEENMNDYGTLVSGRYFSNQEEEAGDAVALLCDDKGSVNSFAESIMIDDKNVLFQKRIFRIVGYQKMHHLIVPFNSLDSDTPLDSLSIHFSKSITRSVYDEIKEKIEMNFPGIAVVQELDIPEAENYYLYNTIIIISILIAILAAVNFSVLYRYIFAKRKKNMFVFRMCGCTRKRAIMMYIGECMLIIVPFFLITTYIYDQFVLPYFGNFFEYIEGAYDFMVYLIIFVIYIVVSLFVLAIMIGKEIIHKTIKEMGV